jgi:hypothetical protein
MRFNSISRLTLVVFMWAAPAAAQDVEGLIANTSPPPRIFLDSDIGVRAELGFIPPSRNFGASLEYPLWRRLEIQGAGSFSPDKKQITDNGHSFSVTGTAIVWPSWRVGVLGEVGYNRLWTSVIRFPRAVCGRRPQTLVSCNPNGYKGLRFDRNSSFYLMFAGARK